MRIARTAQSGVVSPLRLQRSDANMRVLRCHARIRGLLDQGLSRFETIYHGEGEM